MLYTPESSLQVELIVLRPGHRACRCSEAFKRAAEFEKHWRWWAEITHLTGYLSSPAGKDPSRSKNSHWAAWRGLPWKSKLCSFLPTEQRLGECPRSAEPCTSGAGGLLAEGARGWNHQGDGWHRGAVPRPRKTSETVFLCDLGHSLFLLLPVSGPKSSSWHS